jgi:hypothetical protein
MIIIIIIIIIIIKVNEFIVLSLLRLGKRLG